MPSKPPGSRMTRLAACRDGIGDDCPPSSVFSILCYGPVASLFFFPRFVTGPGASVGRVRLRGSTGHGPGCALIDAG